MGLIFEMRDIIYRTKKKYFLLFDVIFSRKSIFGQSEKMTIYQNLKKCIHHLFIGLTIILIPKKITILYIPKIITIISIAKINDDNFFQMALSRKLFKLDSLNHHKFYNR